MNVLKKFDVLSKQPIFTYENSPRYRSIIGGLFTLIIFFLILGIFIKFSLEILDRENPSTLISENIVLSPPKSIINNSTFVFAFGLQEPSTYRQFIDESIFTVSAFIQMRTVIYNSSINKIQETMTHDPIEINRCNVTKMLKISPQFSLIPVQEFFCLDYDFQHFVEGHWDSNLMINLEFIFSACKNTTTSKVVCKDKETIDSKLIGGNFAAKFIDTIVDPNKYDQPITKYLSEFFISSNNYEYQDIIFYLSKNYFKTDDGLIFDSISEREYISLDKTFHTGINLKDGDSTFINFSIRMSKNTKTYFRKYKKFQELMANIGGITKFFLIMVNLLLVFYSQYIMDMSEINNYFSSSNSSKQKSEDFVKHFQTEKNNKLYIVDLKPKEINFYKKMGYFDYLKIKCNCHFRNKQFLKLNKIIKNQFETKTYISKMLAIDKLKCLTVKTEDDMKMMQGIPYFYSEKLTSIAK
jgi:hypothetical protein